MRRPTLQPKGFAMIHEKPLKKAALVTEDSFAALVRAFMSEANPKWFGKYEEATRDLWGRELRFASRPDTLGAVSLQEIRPSLVQAYLDALEGRPGKQAAAKAAFNALNKWAVVRDLLPREIMTGVETGRPEGGHIPWSDAHVALAERHAVPLIAKAVTLGANTGQRGSDLIRMGPTDHELYNGIDGINVTQKKTKRQVWIPVTSPLATAMATWDRRPGPYLRQPDGAAWTRRLLTKAWTKERETNPALEPLRLVRAGDQEKPLVLHGLRATACVRLWRTGANTRQIADMVGMSEEMVANYVRFASQRENAAA